MPTATTATEVVSRFIIGLKAPTRLHDEAFKILFEMNHVTGQNDETWIIQMH